MRLKITACIISILEIYYIISTYIFLANLENRDYARNYFSILFLLVRQEIQEKITINLMPYLYFCDAYVVATI